MYSIASEYKTTLKNEQYLKKFFSEIKELEQNDERRKLFDDDFLDKFIDLGNVFYSKLKVESRVLESIVAGIAKLESDVGYIGLIQLVINVIEHHLNKYLSSLGLTNDEEEKVNSYFEKIKKDCLKKEVFLANLFHPRFKSKFLDEDQLLEAEEYLQSLLEDYTSEQSDEILKYKEIFLAGEKNFNPKFNYDLDNPIIYWKSKKANKHLKLISSFAIKVSSPKATSCPLERIFSKKRLVHTRLRNRLPLKTVTNVVKINHAKNLDLQVKTKKIVLSLDEIEYSDDGSETEDECPETDFENALRRMDDDPIDRDDSGFDESV
jgi:hypothetical protein